MEITVGVEVVTGPATLVVFKVVPAATSLFEGAGVTVGKTAATAMGCVVANGVAEAVRGLPGF